MFVGTAAIRLLACVFRAHRHIRCRSAVGTVRSAICSFAGANVGRQRSYQSPQTADHRPLHTALFPCSGAALRTRLAA